MSLIQLFVSFFKIGVFTIGGGYAMIPLMEEELVERRRCLSRVEFLDLMALSQAMPGVFAVNMATSVGYRLRGIPGTVCAIAGNILVPVLLILLLAMFFRHFRDNDIVNRVFMGIRPAVVALIAAPVFRLAKDAGLSWRTCWVPLLAALLIWVLGVSPVWIIVATILIGIVWGRIEVCRDSHKGHNTNH